MTALYGVRYKRVCVVLRSDVGDNVPMFTHRYWHFVHEAIRLSKTIPLRIENLSVLLCAARRATYEVFWGAKY